MLKHHGSAWGVRGHPDLYGVLPGGRAWFLEVKTPQRRGSVTHHQRAFLGRAREAGALAGIATSVAEALAILDGEV